MAITSFSKNACHSYGQPQTRYYKTAPYREHESSQNILTSITNVANIP